MMVLPRKEAFCVSRQLTTLE